MSTLNNPTFPSNYKSDMKKESKHLIKTIKANMKKRAEEELELLEAGSVQTKLLKFSEKVKKNHGIVKK
jgi:hypothetical protein